MWCLKRFKKSRQPPRQPALLGVPTYIPAEPLDFGAMADLGVPLECVNDGGGSQITPLDGGDEDRRSRASGTSTWTPERENGTETSQKWRCEPGVPSDTPNEQLGQGCPRLYPDPRGFESRNLEEHEDQGPVPPKFVFDNDQFGEDAQHSARFVKSWVPGRTWRATTEHMFDDHFGEDPQHIVWSAPVPSVKIAVMGASGSGKTTFINLATGSNLPIGIGLESCTVEVQLADEFTLNGRAVTLIDTPGFDDTSKIDTEVLKEIGSFLATMYEEGSMLAGVIYVHRISDNQFNGIAEWNFKMFRELCGESALKNVVLVTNMWGVDSQDINESCEKELSDNLFKPALDKGAQIVCHHNTVQSAHDIIWGIMKNHPVVLQIQRELVDEGKNIINTTVGESINQKLKEQNANGSRSDPDEMDPETAAMLTDGMTPVDVLSFIFGATLPPSELEEALATHGYDFDKAINSLIDRVMPTNNQSSAGPIRVQNVGNRVSLVQNGGPGFGGRGNNTKFSQDGRQNSGGNGVCRHFLAGECLRADCRFSHELERAICRFWLRGVCAKGEACEFLHTLPTNIDVNGIANAMARTDLNNQGHSSKESSPPPDEFPTLDHANGSNGEKRGGGAGYGPQGHHDPGRTRFAAAVKKPAPTPRNEPGPDITRRDTGPTGKPIHHRVSVVAPRPSQRLKLRPPTLLPTLPTGDSVNKLYMGYRSRALQLGAARNACLSRAADAWRRGDGAAAKRFSREGHELNAKMSSEMADAAGQLVKERARLAEQAVRGREAAWSDDQGDRTSRGKVVGGGLGVCLGIARTDVGGTEKLSPEERTEAALDLHGLHANEATEVLESFLIALEQEHFYGLAYAVVGEEKHTGTQDPARGASRARLAAGVREWLHMWGYPWSERNDGIICIDPLTHA